jgi:fluoroquinolone transport system ATP-binding protein
MIHASNLTFKYPKSASDTIKDISFSIQKGEIYGFLGPSGAGKSTTQKILIRLLSGFSGEVEINGKSLSNWNNTFYNFVGVGFELPNHYLKLTGLENLKLFSSFYDKPASNPYDLLNMVGLGDAANQKVEDYSKGMKMRLNFVRALLNDPDILFLDEPTSGLDPVNARNIKNIILEQKARGKTIFITTHNMHDADELCDRVAFIIDGQIMADAPPKELKMKYGRPIVVLEYVNQVPETIEFDLKTLDSNQDFFTIIKNYPISSIHSQEASLDDVFIKITGRKLNAPV